MCIFVYSRCHENSVYYNIALTIQALSLALLGFWSPLYHVNWKSWDWGTCDISALLLNSNVKIVGGRRMLMTIFKRKQSKISSRDYTRHKYYSNNKVKILVYRKCQTHHQLSWYSDSSHTFNSIIPIVQVSPSEILMNASTCG